MACRLIYDLGLHDNIPSSKLFSGPVEQSNSFRKGLVVACVTYDRLWSLYLGRASGIAHSALFLPHPSQSSLSEPLLTAWLRLCEPMTEITNILNDPVISGSTRATRLSELDNQLTDWHASLPADLVLDLHDFSDASATAFGLHMQFYRIRMLVHRAPTITAGRKRKLGSENSQSPTLNNWTREESNELIYENSIRISRLGFAYRQIYGTENTPSIMLDNLYVAARTLILRVLRRTEVVSDDDTDTHWLTILDETMEALQVHFPITRRMRKTLARLVSGTQLSQLFDDTLATCPPLSMNMTSNTSDFREGNDFLPAGPWGSFETVFDDFIYDPSTAPIDMDSDLWAPVG